MDLNNREDLLRLAKTQADKEKVFMFTSFAPNKSHIDPKGPEGGILSVPDPYGGPIEEFQSVLKIIESAAEGFLSWVRS
jgi:protein-tyrosine-phosphatase